MKRVSVFSMVLIIGIFCSGCTSVKFYNDTIPIDDCSVISPGIGVTITGVSGSYRTNFTLTTGMFGVNRWWLIPSGEQSITANYAGPEGSANGIKSELYDFESGHYYFISGDTSDGKARLAIYDITDSGVSSFEKKVENAEKKIDSLKRTPHESSDTRNNVSAGFVHIDGGTFTMGSPSTEIGNEENYEIQHQVTVNGFYMGKYEVTQSEYKAVIGTNPSIFKGAKLPVEHVTWYDAIEY
jgi:hypothetical protein